MGFRLPQPPPTDGPVNDEAVVLAHVRAPSAGAPGWPGTAVTIIPGVDPSVSIYDSDDPYGEIEDHLDYEVRGGVARYRTLVAPQEYTRTRRTRVSAFQSSIPAGTFFQGLFGQTRWSGVFQGFGLAPRPLTKRGPLVQNMNPGAFGSKELHKATQYEPVPPMGSIVGYYGSHEKAL